MNSRNQVLELKMGNSPTNGGLMHLTYEYGEFDTGGNVDVTKNAGNIAKQTITFNGLANPFVQSYKYDSLDRITEAKETVNGGQTWIQTFGYDRYGNRTSHAETVGSQAKAINEVTLPAVDASTNKFSNTTDYEFDAVGNLIRDVHGRQFTFNGDNKQVEVRNSANQVVGEYKYDGLGKRIKKETATEYVVFVYDGLGKLIGEYAADGPPAAPTVSYTATDPLGSPRVLTNKQGEVVSRRDFMPFGEEIVAMAETHRTPGDKYGVGDGVRQKFTGYERDEETGLDFAEARYYYNNHGRFTAVDPLLASGKSADPQTFNRYAYVLNSPLVYVDRDGLCPRPTLSPGQVGICVEAFIAAEKINVLGNGDGRTHESDSNATARMRVSFTLTATPTEVSQNVTEAIVAGSTVSIPGVAITELLPIPAGESKGKINLSGYSTAAPGTNGFGDGKTTETVLNVGLREGANAAQVAAESPAAIAAGKAAESAGPVPAAIAQIAKEAIPKGTIDVQARITITGEGDNIQVKAKAMARPFPSVTGWAYVGLSDGSVRTTRLFYHDETKPSDLVKPMRPIN